MKVQINFLILAALIAGTVFGQGFGTSEKLHDWYFHLGDVKLGGRQTLDHSKWEKVIVPH